MGKDARGQTNTADWSKTRVMGLRFGRIKIVKDERGRRAAFNKT